MLVDISHKFKHGGYAAAEHLRKKNNRRPLKNESLVYMINLIQLGLSVFGCFIFYVLAEGKRETERCDFKQLALKTTQADD